MSRVRPPSPAFPNSDSILILELVAGAGVGQTEPIPQPLLIVVTGRPGAGKTTLAHALAREVRCPAICRDEIKEGFVNMIGRIGTPDDEIERGIYQTFFDTI